MMDLKVKKLNQEATLPTVATSGSAGADLYACLGKGHGVRLTPGEVETIPTGIACEIPEGYFGLLVVRSSIGAKRNLVLANTVGIIDSDYRGEIMVILRNVGDKPQMINHDERVAQLILLPVQMYNIVEAETLSVTDRGEGGFGSTGK